jgi:hypothetical protein
MIWWKSKTIWTAAVGLVVAIITAAGVVDEKTGASIGAGLLALAITFLRLGVGDGGTPPGH